ncbi:MAG: hypothetical protein KGQ59_03415 [Bdellovibrionales bacterium]|nr:hypothetical protein [Bdellovibrionales bacterium]
MMRLLLVFFMLSFLSSPVFSEEGHEEKGHSHEEGDSHGEENEEEGSASNVGEDKGVIEASRSKGFKLTPESVKHLGIKTIDSKKEGQSFTLPKSALVSVKRERFVYTFNNGFYKAVEVVVAKASSTQITVTSEHDPISGQVVTEGVHFLRNIEVDIFSGDEGGHHH